MGLKSYRELDVWQKAVEMVIGAYRLGAKFPSDQKFGLTGQLQRAAVSVPANIAEGYGRSHRGDYLRHLSITRGSLAEVETLLTIAVRLGFVAREETIVIWDLCQDIGKMLNRLIQSLEEPAKRNTPNPRPGTRDPRPGTRYP
ncbi:MAG TPA: four helix bundle protein [Candidatus Hydrogenedentes bacterium]|nr:four helix bundle protein [Candidatus Hydrogenedentota bacterium]